MNEETADPNEVIDHWTNLADVASNYLGGETWVTQRGRYGIYHYLDEIGKHCTYHWAQRANDYGHRVFASQDECRRYVAGEAL